MWVLVAFILMIVSDVAYFVTCKQIWEVIDTPTVTPSGAIIGLCEVEGKATTPISPDGKSLPLKLSPVSKVACVWYKVLVERYIQEGKNSRWVTFRSRESTGGFRLYDNFGAITIIPDNSSEYLDQPFKQSSNPAALASVKDFFVNKPGAEEKKAAAQWTTSPDGYYMWHPHIKQWIQTRFVSPDRQYYYDWQKAKWIDVDRVGILGSLFKRGEANWENSQLRVTETVIYPDSMIFTHGYINVSRDGTDLEMTKEKKSSSGFFISSKGQSNLIKNLKIRKWIIFVVAFLLSFFMIGMFLNAISKLIFEESYSENIVKNLSIQLGAVFVLFLIGSFLLKLFRIYNRFVKIREQIRMSYSAIDVTLKRRSSLIPELCEIVDGIVQHEREVMEKITTLRNQNPSDFSKELIALAEQYPKIKSSTNFMQLQNELGRTEEKVAMSRSFYNDSVLALNNLRATMLGMLFAPFFKKETPLTL
ncbi:MAG: LemA family protein [Acidimicrobiia bacterium]